MKQIPLIVIVDTCLCSIINSETALLSVIGGLFPHAVVVYDEDYNDIRTTMLLNSQTDCIILGNGLYISSIVQKDHLNIIQIHDMEDVDNYDDLIARLNTKNVPKCSIVSQTCDTAVAHNPQIKPTSSRKRRHL